MQEKLTDVKEGMKEVTSEVEEVISKTISARKASM
jgi:hypothetical protein